MSSSNRTKLSDVFRALRKKSLASTGHKHCVLGRRQLLQTGGGLSLALPFLPSLAAGSTQELAPRRIINIRSYHGLYVEDFYPVGDGWQDLGSHKEADLKPVNRLSRLCSPAFAGLEDEMIFIKGLDPYFQGKYSHNSTFMLGSYSAKPKNQDDEILFFHETMDQLLAKHVYDKEPLKRFLLCGNRDMFSVGEVAGKLQLLTGQRYADEVFKSIFFASGSDQQSSRAQMQKSLVDLVYKDYQEFMKHPRLSNDDHKRLEHHMESLFAMSQRLDQGQSATCKAPAEPREFPALNESTAEDIYNLHIDVIVAALRCNLTQVVNLNLATHGITNLPQSHHSLHHDNDRDSLAKIDEWYLDKVAQLARRLKGESDPVSGLPLLDHTLLFYSKELSDETHDIKNPPVLLLGGRELGYSGGRMLDYARLVSGFKYPVGRVYNQLVTTIMHSMGLNYSQWEQGTSQGFGDYSVTRSNEPSPSIIPGFNERRGLLPGLLTSV